MRVVDPSGEPWDVSRDWVGLPRWSRWRRDSIEAGDTTRGIPEIAFPDLAGVVAAAVVVLVVGVLWTFVVPALLLFAGVLVAGGTVVAKVLSLQPWRIEARSPRARLVWWVRGPRASRRAIRSVASRLEQGAEPLVDGRPPASVDS
jgi:hypothetical protein